jgi:hypothetical protein
MPLLQALSAHIKPDATILPGKVKRRTAYAEQQRAQASVEQARSQARLASERADGGTKDQVKSFHYADRTITISTVVAPSTVLIGQGQWQKSAGSFETIMEADGTVTYQSSTRTKIVESPIRGRGERQFTFEFSDGVRVVQDPMGDQLTFTAALVPSEQAVLTEFYLGTGKKVSLYECFNGGFILKRFVLPTYFVEFRIGDWGTWEVLKRFQSGDYVLDRYRNGHRTSRWQYYAISHHGIVTDDYGVRYFKQNKDGTLTFVDPSVDSSHSASLSLPSPFTNVT